MEKRALRRVVPEEEFAEKGLHGAIIITVFFAACCVNFIDDII